MSRQIGFPGAVQVGERPGWSRQLGDFVETLWEGNRDAIYSLAQQVREVADEYDVEQMGARCRLRVKTQLDAGQSDLVTEVRLYNNRSSKSIWTHPHFDALTQDERKQIKKTIDNNSDLDTSTLTQLGIDLYVLLLNDVQSTLFRQPVLTRTTTASGRYAFINPDQGIPETIYTTTQLIAGGALSGLIDPSLLPNLTSSNPKKAYGWFYWGPEIIGTTGGRKQMIQEWEYGIWDDLYNFA